MTQHYIGTKQVLAEPMTRREYNEFRGWEIPANEAGMEDDPGYMVVYPDSPSNTDKINGYVSWSPKAVFESAYLPMGEDADPSKINEQMVADFIVDTETTRMGNHTVVIAYLRNGFTVIGESACVDPANYNEAVGHAFAMDKIHAQVWKLLGFLLATARHGVTAG